METIFVSMQHVRFYCGPLHLILLCLLKAFIEVLKSKARYSQPLIFTNFHPTTGLYYFPSKTIQSEEQIKNKRRSIKTKRDTRTHQTINKGGGIWQKYHLCHQFHNNHIINPVIRLQCLGICSLPLFMLFAHWETN